MGLGRMRLNDRGRVGRLGPLLWGRGSEWGEHLRGGVSWMDINIIYSIAVDLKIF